MLKETELLIPAGSLDVLKTAVNYGANAVYLGGEAFGLRANAKNFTLEEIREGVAYAHAHQVKVFVTANIFAHNYDLDGVRAYFRERTDYRRSGCVYDREGGPSGIHRAAHLDPGEQHELADLPLLVAARREACRLCT